MSTLAQLASDLDQIAYETVPKTVALLQVQGDGLAELARSLCPKGETLRLSESIWATVDPVGLTAEVGPFAFYGHFVEFGTEKMAPEPYMGPAADQYEPEFVKAMEALGGDVL